MSSSSVSPSSTSAAAAATSSAVTHTLQASKNLKVVGIILAITSGLLIGSSFVFKKKGLLRAQAGGEAGEGVGYLKSPLWWLGMSMMILGEICNFAAYAFIEAIVVTPLGALSVVVCAILSSIFLKEKLSFFGWLGCALCILGSIIIALNGPQEQSVGQIKEFQKLFLAPGFVVYASILIATSLVIIFYFAPKYGKKSMLWYIFVCSMIGGISVSVTTGLGAAIVQTAMGDNQFKYWFMYFLAAFVIVTLITEVYYLNVALALFNTAMVTPTYYVIFTFFSMVTTVVLFQGLHATVAQIITIAMAFLIICLGITILQMSKVDPVHLSKLDRRSTILLQAAREQTETADEKGAMGVEDPGMDTLRGSFGTVGSIIRARTVRRMSQSSARGRSSRHRPQDISWLSDNPTSSQDQHLPGMKRHQLYDAPVPHDDTSSIKTPSLQSQMMNKRPTIKFDSQDVVHQYNRPGTGDDRATHEHRLAVGSPRATMDGYPPLPALPPPTPTPRREEPDFLDMGSPGPPIHTPLTTPLQPLSSQSQLLSLDPNIEEEHTVRSAPPTVFTRFARKDSREPFIAPSPSETLLSFPSVTDSARSQNWDEHEREAELERVAEQSRKREKERESGRTTKRYPKGDGEDDHEESISLWQRDEEDDGYDGLPPDAKGGIRLVQKGSRNMF